jgi:hypothetical protein
MSQFTADEAQGVAAALREWDTAANVRASVGASLHMPESPPKGGLGQRVASASGIGPPMMMDSQQLGPWNASIGFKDGVAVGGWANLGLSDTGSVNFSGHFHVSGAISYDTAFVWAVKDAVGNIYTFQHTGRVHGTFEPGSRDDDWGKSEIYTFMHDHWGELYRSWSWRWEARVNADFVPFLDAVIKLVAAGQAIGKVISIVA